MPASVELSLRKAERLRQKGQRRAALRLLEEAARHCPHEARLRRAIAALKTSDDDIDADIARLKEALADSHGPYLILNQIGNLYARKANHSQAVAYYREALSIEPAYAPAHSNLGNAHKALGDWSSAIACHQQAVALDPHQYDLLYNLGLSLLESGAFGDAEAPLRAALALKPEDYRAANDLGIVLCRVGRPREAVAILSDATAREPDTTQGWINLGHALIDAGSPSAALEAYERALKLDPDCLPAQISRLQYSKQSLNSPLIPNLTGRLNDPRESVASRVSAAFGLGKALLDCGRDEDAFSAYSKGNALHASTQPPPADHAQRLQTLRKLDRKHFAQFRAVGPAERPRNRLPVLIVGMPRSGKSLCESLLSEHPAVYAAGELETLQRHVKMLFRDADETNLMNWQWRNENAGKLLESLPGDANHERVVYTLPGHLWILHQIAALLPEAPIVYCQRDPFDLAIANYFKHFANGNLFSYDMETIGREIRQFQLLMEHWQGVLPNPGLAIDYETLVRDTSLIAQRLCTHTGLPWSDQCLAGLHQDHSLVDALGPAGSIDAPTPIRSDFVGISQRFRHHLTTFSKALQGSDVVVPDRQATLSSINDQLNAGNIHGTLPTLTHLIEQHPGDLALRTLHARACSLLGRDTEAIESFERLMSQVDLGSASTVGLQREYIEALLRAHKLQAAATALSRQALPAPIHERLRLKHAVACGSRSSDLAQVALRHLQASGAKDAEALSLYASLDPSAQSVTLHRRALSLAPNAERWLRAAASLDGEARCEALWQAAQIKPLSRVSTTAYAQLREHLATTRPALGLLHDELHQTWSRYREDTIQHSFGDFGLPYQSLESILLPGTRPTATRLHTYGLHRWLAPHARALDIGCNHGFLLLGLADRLRAGLGFDISPTCIAVGQTVAKAIGKHHIELRRQDYQDFLATTESGFDLIIACAVHRWIEMPLPAFGRTLHSLLNPGGLALIESQGRRSTKTIEAGFQESVAALAGDRFTLLHQGRICDDHLNLRGFSILQRT